MKKNIKKIVIISLVSLLVLGGVSVFVFRDKLFADISNSKKAEEYTISEINFDKDFKDVAKLEQEVFGGGSDVWNEEQLKSGFLQKNSYVFIAKSKSGEIAGYIWLVERSDPAAKSPIKEGHISKIAVKESHRRNSVGSMLMSKSISISKEKGAQYVSLNVRTNNTPAMNLYKKFGFIIYETSKNYYGEGQDAYVMVRFLNS